MIPGSVATALLLTSSLASQAAAAINLNATVRDFTPTHPDFEHYLGNDVGAVQTTLGPSKNPVLSAASRPTITSAASFAQWYDDVPGVNLNFPLTLTLTETSPGSGIFAYGSSSFFPIDGLGFGNYSGGHNFHFTMELHSTFTYQVGQQFSFTGDDDLWVYINNQLAIDLGGVHGALSDSVDLDTLGLTPGQTYDFDLFFAERHTSDSNFFVETSIPLVSGPSESVPEPGTVLAGLAIVASAGVAYRRRVTANRA